MRKFTATLLTLILSLQAFAGKVIKNPDIEYNAGWMTITEIELTKEATIIHGILKGGSCIVNKTVLADRNTGKEFKFIRVEGIKAKERAAEGTPCSVYFEPLDAMVKEFNYIEGWEKPMDNYYGIKLQQKAKPSKKLKTFAPESLDYDYYMSQPFTPDTAWHFSNEPYKRAMEGGKAQLKIHVNNIPREITNMLSTASARVTNQITNQDENSLASIDENNCYIFDLNLPYPQFICSVPFGSIYIAPGDTLEMFYTIESSPDSRDPCFRSNSESAMINTLLPKFLEKYGRKEYKYEEAKAIIEKGKDATQAILDRWANQADEIIADKELRQALINSPLSTRGKDLVMMSALADKCIEIEDVVDDYPYNAYKRTRLEEGSRKIEPYPDYVEIDLKSIYNSLLKNKELIYNNPLAVSESSQWVFINRTLGGPLLKQFDNIKDNEGNIIEIRRRDDYGMTGTFMNDLYLSQEAVFNMEKTLKRDNLDQLAEHRTEVLDYTANTVGESLAKIQNITVAQTVVGEYRKFVKATETCADEKGNNWTEEQNVLWNKIVSPYKGNTLFLDFWNMGCGPCRVGMMTQRKLVEEMKDEKFKFLYITTEDQKDSAEKWMGENNIKGEHVYITRDEWKQVQTMINFSGIPRGALVNKEGKLIENDFDVSLFNSAELKKLAERF